MSIQQKISDDWKEAMKARDPKKDVLSLMRTELKNKAINERTGGDSSTEVSDPIALDVLMKMAKQRRESIDSYKTANRADLVDKETFELSVIESYLPKQMTDEEIRQAVKDAIISVQATSAKDMGKVMGAVLPKLKGRADGGKVQAIVRECLTGV